MDRDAGDDRSLDDRSLDNGGVTAPVLRPTLVLGGARSGKSRFAEQLIVDSGLARIYLATATAGGDAEMVTRIAHHREQRGDGWRTIEEPLALVETLSREAGSGRAVLVDCLTLWLANLMYAGGDFAAASRALAGYLRQASHPVVLVSNEVGLGLVPETALGREFRDAQGRLNQIVAAAVPNVVFIAAGLPLWLKRSTAGEPTA
ncbi:MAG TPA: bifunctional adenosylcobinamide kinase/adenosylcobinamide-phosphate guanylyltransferase [Rhodopseudomonas sp.]|uniref:bifunctional adenosylcobinamide kinase/adenosylcobinamide-phosphate guanylyltransferase n=1 Tax=Rhodopseudomonas sp. TaxID=1078 RepID=UPI002ED8C453